MKKKIGVIDSGLGGIMVLNACEDAFPNYDYVFIGDQQHAPYGDRNPNEVYQYAKGMIMYFETQQIEDVIIACNTICANVLDQLVNDFKDMRLYGIIDATAKELPKHCHHVLVLATAKTVETHAYKRAIQAWIPSCQVSECAAIKFVPLLENNGSETAIKEALTEYLSPYLNKVDAVILGCTHYPIIKAEIEAFMKVPVYDSNAAVIKSVPFEMDAYQGSVKVFTTKDKHRMYRQILNVIKKDYDVDEISLQE